jgi:hypothetical protein
VSFLAVNPEKIPATMRALPNWMYWRLEPDKKTGKPTKVPYMVAERGVGSSTDPGTWASFADAVAGMASANGSFSFDGLGFALENTGIVFIDFDGVRNVETGEIAPWASELISGLASYTEVSPSGDGLHVYTLGKLPGTGTEPKFLDGSAMGMYDSGRYTTVTGLPITSFPDDLRAVDVQALYESLKAGTLRPGQSKPTTRKGVPSPAPVPQPSSPASNVLGLLEKFGLTITAIEDPYRGATETGKKFVLSECPFDAGHKDAAIFDFPSGPVFYCFHTSCRGKNWAAFCSLFDFSPLILGAKGKPLGLLANAVFTLKQSPEWRGALGFNQMSCHAVLRKPAPWPQSRPGENWSDVDSNRTTVWLQQRGIYVNPKTAGQAVHTVAADFEFHPVREYLDSLVWDGTPRLLDWPQTYLGAAPSPLVSAMGQCWMISGVARVMQPGCKVDFVLVLEGKQGIGKSTALQVLASPAWHRAGLSDMASKESQLELRGYWIVELGEFITKRSEQERKQFLTKTNDDYRPPYGYIVQQVPRTCIFGATTNTRIMLSDSTGGRRYWPISCTRVDLPGLQRDRDRLWAEAVHLYRQGTPWWPDFAEFSVALETEQENRYQGGPNDQLVLSWVKNPEQREDWVGGTKVPVEPFHSNPCRVTITDILQHCLGCKPPFQPRDWNPVIACLEHAGWTREEKKTRVGRDIVRFYVPEKVPLPWE